MSWSWTRLWVYSRLATSEARVTEIAEEFPISLNSTSKHIKVLERAGLVRRDVRGRDHVLSLNVEARRVLGYDHNNKGKLTLQTCAWRTGKVSRDRGRA